MNTSLTEGALSLIMQHPNIVRSLAYEAAAKRVPSDGATHEIRLLMEFCDLGSLDKAVAAGHFHRVDAAGNVQARARLACRRAARQGPNPSVARPFSS